MYLLVGVSARALLESAVESGCQATAIDYFGDQDCRWRGPAFSLADLGLRPSVKNLLQAAATLAFAGRNGRRQAFSGLVYSSGPENQPQDLEVWAQHGLLLGNGPATLARVRNPWELRDTLAAVGSAMPPFYPLEEWRYTPAGMGWLIKPVRGGGGRGIRLLAATEAGAAAQLAAVSDKSRYLVQQFIPGIAASATFIADGRQAAVVGTSQQLAAGNGLGTGRFAYAGSIVPLALQPAHGLPDPGPELARIAGHLTAVFGLRGLNTLDFIINQRGIWVLEVNPRWSASVELIERWRGERLFRRHVAACGPAGLPAAAIPSARGRRCGFWGKAIVYAQASFQVTATARELGDFYRLGLRDIPGPATSVAGGQPLCSVLAWAGTAAACRQALVDKAAWARRVLGDVAAARGDPGGGRHKAPAVAEWQWRFAGGKTGKGAGHE